LVSWPPDLLDLRGPISKIREGKGVWDREREGRRKGGRGF